MIRNKYILIITFAIIHLSMYSQVQPNPRQVLGTTGGSNTAPWGTVDYTVGEVMVTTYSPGSPFTIKTLTQGFQQPDDVLGVTEASINSTCIGANNGSIALTPLNAHGPVTYTWNPSVAGNTNFASNLAPGTYNYIVSDSVGDSIAGSVVILEDQVKCKEIILSFYTGITPNGDGFNDTWVIDSIIYFPDNIVSIYNRWGDLVWSAKHYDNVNVVWDGSNRGGKQLPDATYFYLVETQKEKFKGWVELTH
jgi:gliding motility-associated-like protein